MRVAVIGSNGLRVDDIGKFLPEGTTELVVGFDNDIDDTARSYAFAHGLGTSIFMPLYVEIGREIPTPQIEFLVKFSNMIIAFWDEKSEEIRLIADNCKELAVPIKIYVKKENDWKEL